MSLFAQDNLLENVKIGIIGLGYVGLPLAIACAQKGYPTIGYDINKKRIQSLNLGSDLNGEATRDELLSISDFLSFTCDPNDLINCNFYIVAVPTPIDKGNYPDLSLLKAASAMVGSIIKQKIHSTSYTQVNQDLFIVFESTVYPGVTEEICVPEIHSSSGLELNKHFYVGYSPERVSPGLNSKKVNEIVKLTSGSNDYASEFIDKFYSSIITAGTYSCESIKVAETAKIYENTQRDVGIALANELSILCTRLNINSESVTSAAKSKWNFVPWKAGLVGGHCIGVDPYYLRYCGESVGVNMNLVSSARIVNDSMPGWVVKKIIKDAVRCSIDISKAKALVVGVTFKENCSDIRNSKNLELVQILGDYGIDCVLVDPLVEKSSIPQSLRSSYIDLKDMDSTGKKFDIVILSCLHDQLKNLGSQYWESLARNKQSLVIDLKGYYNGLISSWSL
ncbi:nucleotide sugar dehydrogenase [Synechococcus sp. UW140]|uniref:nucleotide sugar dehydrogenase n=1 Tax=Synechococcus sp. UW140 TaxID=368503 RepID=UPI003138412A